MYSEFQKHLANRLKLIRPVYSCLTNLHFALKILKWKSCNVLSFSWSNKKKWEFRGHCFKRSDALFQYCAFLTGNFVIYWWRVCLARIFTTAFTKTLRHSQRVDYFMNNMFASAFGAYINQTFQVKEVLISATLYIVCTLLIIKFFLSRTSDELGNIVE